jgi:hypothetical protein
VIAAMFGATGPVPAPAMAEIMPNAARVALIAGIAVSLAPIATKYRASAPAAERPWPLAFAASAGYLVLFLAASIHLTNMRFTPLIYFKF